MKLSITFSREIRPDELQHSLGLRSQELLADLHARLGAGQEIAVKIGVEKDAQQVEASKPPMLDLFGGSNGDL